VPNLEPDVRMSEGAWRVSEDAIEARERVFVLSLLLVNNTEPEKDFVSLIEI
jgi:hypothetical protein